MPPVIDCLPWQVMGSIDNPGMFTQNLPFGGDNDPFRVNPQADRPIGKRSRNAVAVALKMHEAGRRYPLGMFDEAVEGPPQSHQAGNLSGMRIGDGTGQSAMLDLSPLFDAAFLEPGVERSQVREAGQRLPQPPPRILHVLLNLALLPAGSRVTEIRLEQIMAGHGGKARIHLPGFA